ncbi:FAD-dependent monooxygenase [Micromonospora sp. DT31]|uniref:FAD-dependent monooxygenase n=1 Tax=Micromonospora sp. DT31 TaxID=3393434 RepID=UPI003CE994F0
MPVDVDVVVVGAGPVGCALAVELGRRGVSVKVVDAGDGDVTFPAGEAIFSRTMEHLRRWGIADRARAEGVPAADYPHRIVFMTRLTGHLLTDFDTGATNAEPGEFGAVSPEGPAFLSKFSFLPLLEGAAAAEPTVTVEHGKLVTGLVQGSDDVQVLVVDQATEQEETVSASYVVGCDGGRSWVRRHLGIDFDGAFAQGRNFAVHFRAPALKDLLQAHGGGLAAQIQTLADERRPYITVVDGVDEWRLSVYLDQDPAPGDEMRWVHAAVGAPIDVEIIRAQPWSGHRVVADRYRDGRVFLAGDAAHLLWPKGGFGANTGIGDAVDLGWKLAAVLQGWAGDALLDSYEAERRPIAVRNVSEASSNWTSDAQIVPDPVLDQDDDAGRDARADMGRLIQELRGREFRSAGVQLGYRYEGSPVVVPDGTPPPPDEPDVYVPSTRPGSRAPHVWLPDGTSLLDHFDVGLTVVDTRPSWAGDLADLADLVGSAADRGVPLNVLRLTADASTELYGERLTIVRPDGHVAWRAANPPSDPGALLDTICGREAPGTAFADPVRETAVV